MYADLKFAARQLAKSPGFAAVAILSLALGIGANTAIFSLVNAFLLRPLPVSRPDELILFRNLDGARGGMSRSSDGPGYVDPASGRYSGSSFSLLTFERFRAYHPGLTDVFAFASFNPLNVLVEGQPEIEVSGQFVSGNYHTALGVPALLGRILTSDDDQPAAEPVAVISHRYWQSRFAGDPAVLGRTIDINKVLTTIVGVTPSGFAGTMQVGESLDISVPLAHITRFHPGNLDKTQPWFWWVRIMGRLAPGATAAQARASLEPVFQETAREGWLVSQSLATNAGIMPDAPTLAADPGGRGENDNRRQHVKSLRALMALVGFVLLASCANVANLLLARGAARRREIAVRLALGASRGRVVRQLLAESLLLAFLGAALGTLLAFWSRGLLLALQPFGNAALVLDLPLDGRVLGFTLLVAVATALGFGLVPALRATRLDLNAEFQGGTRSLGGGRCSRLSQALVVLQIALSLVLLVSTGLFVRTLRNLQNVDAGFNRRQLVLFRIDAGPAGYSVAGTAVLHARLRERLEKIPGVSAATFSNQPLLSSDGHTRGVSVQGYTPRPRTSTSAYVNSLAPNFFSAMELPLVLGRGFTERDDASAPKIAVVNQTFARKYFGDENPIGRRFGFDGAEHSADLEIVGVARDAKYTGLRAAIPPTAYVPALQQKNRGAHFAVRLAPAISGAAIRDAVREIDPALPVLNLRTQDEQIDRLHVQELLFARLSGFFGAVALALACLGLYGVMSHAALRRTGEIGLRMALGALPTQVLRMILRESLELVGMGIVLGLTGAWFASRLIATMLYGLSPTDPFTYALVAGLLVAVALLSALLPAHRASRVEPMKALRAE